MSALRGLLRKEIVHIRRDPRTLTVLIALPIVQVVLFGYAIRTDVTNVRLAIVDPMPDHATLDLRSRFAAAGVFRIVAVVPRPENLEPLFQTGAAQQAGPLSGRPLLVRTRRETGSTFGPGSSWPMLAVSSTYG